MTHHAVRFLDWVRAHPQATTTNKKALKASLHLVMAMVRMMDNVDPRHSALEIADTAHKNVRLSIRR